MAPTRPTSSTNFGLVHSFADADGAYTPKPGRRPIRRDFAAADGSPFRVLWAASGANTTVTVASSGPVNVTSLYALPSTFYPDANGQVTFPVGVWPTYLSGSSISTVTSP